VGIASNAQGLEAPRSAPCPCSSAAALWPVWRQGSGPSWLPVLAGAAIARAADARLAASKLVAWAGGNLRRGCAPGAVSEPVGWHQTPAEMAMDWEDRLASDYGGGACGWPSRTAAMARCNSSIMKGLDTYGVPEFSRKALVASLTVSPVVKMMRPANSG